MKMLWNINEGEVVARKLQSPLNWFPITMREAEYGLPSPQRQQAEGIEPAPPGPPRKPVAQFHCLARRCQQAHGGAHGTLRTKQVAFSPNALPSHICFKPALTGCHLSITSGKNDITTRTPSLLIDAPIKIW
jgi:hypothetical protein